MSHQKFHGKKILTGIEPLKWEDQTDTTAIASLAKIMKYLGEDTSYTQLMGTSGAAFHLAFHQPEWCPSSPDMYSLDTSIDHLGYKIKTLADKTQDYERLARIKIKESIDNNMPVLAIDLLENVDWGIIVGYENDDLIVRDFYDADSSYSVAKNFPWIIKLIEKIHPPNDYCGTIIRSLRKSLDRFYKEELLQKYASGTAAYDVWIEQLRDHHVFESLDETNFKRYWHTHAWIYNNLLSAREQASKFLYHATNYFKNNGANLLNRSADLYQQIHSILYDNWTSSPYPQWVDPKKEMIWVPPREDPRWIDTVEWTQTMRDEAANVLSKVHQLEEKAMYLITKFLKNVTDDCCIDC